MSSGNLKMVKSAVGFGSLSGVNSEPATTLSPTAGTLSFPARTWFGLKPIEAGTLVVVSVLVLLASYRAWWPIGIAEAWGFVTGGICVWLVVRQHMWNWPVGLANNVFYPPHRGHKLLIDTATAQSEQAVVIVCAKPTDTIPGELRGQWLQEIHPTARVMVIDDRYNENDSRV